MEIIAAVLFVLVALAAGDGDCDNDAAPHVRLDCVIVAGDTCNYESFHNGFATNICNYNSDCQVTVGVALQIVCDGASSEELILYRDNITQGTPNMSWPFAESFLEGSYDCRWKYNGTLYANRSIVVDERVALVPGGLYEQFCRKNISPEYSPNYNCSTAHSTELYSAAQGGPHSVAFNVLGTRPINLSVAVLWGNHYPVDLHLSWRHAIVSTYQLTHSVDLNIDDVVSVGSNPTVKAYVAITATTVTHSVTMCVSLEINAAESTLFPNESLPNVVAVATGQTANFSCDALTNMVQGFAHTVAFLVHSPTSNITECFNCSFSPAEILYCNPPVETGTCSSLEYTNSSSGHPNLLNHRLTARWTNPTPSDSDSEVLCALAYSGVIQWVHTATLLVTLPTPTPVETPHSSQPQLVALAGLVLVVVVAGSLCVLGLILWYRHRYRTSSNPSLAVEEMPLAGSPLPSSGSNTPTLTPGYSQLPVITVNHLHHSMEHRHIQRLDENRDSMDSGLDVGDIEAWKVSGSHLQVAGVRSHSLNDLQSSSTQEVCVYVSYADSQAEWVRDTLLPLLHSFQPITVTDHEGHMIAGSVISEERLRLLRSADKVVAVVSPDYHSMEWCCYELQHAIQQSPGAEGHLIPILCSGCSELPSTISTLHPIFLTDPNWTHKLRIAIRRKHHRSN